MERQQIGVAVAVDRDARQLACRDELPHLGIVGFHLSWRLADGHRLRLGSQDQLDIDSQGGIRIHHYAYPFEWLESGVLDLQLIIALRQCRKAVDPFVVRGGLTRQTRLRVAGHHGHARHHGTAGIGN